MESSVRLYSMSCVWPSAMITMLMHTTAGSKSTLASFASSFPSSLITNWTTKRLLTNLLRSAWQVCQLCAMCPLWLFWPNTTPLMTNRSRQSIPISRPSCPLTKPSNQIISLFCAYPSVMPFWYMSSLLFYRLLLFPFLLSVPFFANSVTFHLYSLFLNRCITVRCHIPNVFKDIESYQFSARRQNVGNHPFCSSVAQLFVMTLLRNTSIILSIYFLNSLFCLTSLCSDLFSYISFMFPSLSRQSPTYTSIFAVHS